MRSSAPVEGLDRDRWEVDIEAPRDHPIDLFDGIERLVHKSFTIALFHLWQRQVKGDNAGLRDRRIGPRTTDIGAQTGHSTPAPPPSFGRRATPAPPLHAGRPAASSSTPAQKERWPCCRTGAANPAPAIRPVPIRPRHAANPRPQASPKPEQTPECYPSVTRDYRGLGDGISATRTRRCYRRGIGAPGRNRTCDPKLRRLVLYPTELRTRGLR